MLKSVTNVKKLVKNSMCSDTKQERFFLQTTASVEVKTDDDDDVPPPLQQGAPIGTNELHNDINLCCKITHYSEHCLFSPL